MPIYSTRCSRDRPNHPTGLKASCRQTGASWSSRNARPGKTTFGLNLALALIDGGHFLDRFAVRPIDGNIAVLNYEVTGRQLARWAHEVGVPGDRLLLVNLRGRRNPLGYIEDRERLVDLLRGHSVVVLLVDPFGRAFTGRNQNDASEVTPWLADLDRLADAAGITELALSTHAGWGGERSGGSSALEDWADSIATMTRDPDDQTTRCLSAFGRDVEVSEDRLAFDAATRTLTLTGAGSRRQGRTERAVAAAENDVLAYVTANPGCSVRNIREGLPGAHGVLDEARKRLVLRGDVKETDSKRRGGGKAYNVTDKAGEQISVRGVPNRAPAHLGGVPGVSIEGTPPTTHLTDDQPRRTSEALT
jgi:AAA domain